MAARSPRGSLSGASDIASDFEDALKDLQRPDKFAIENITNVARESTEHAQAISRVLENHIKTVRRLYHVTHHTPTFPCLATTHVLTTLQTAPSRKLPALYVLDSIIKNVGTPYTVYLARNLYSTFMEAYTLVDGTTRRQMDNLLKTWKEPVPGTHDHRPVFEPETVRPIENALIKAKTAALQNQRQVQPQQAYRTTPTPPQHSGQYAPPHMANPQQQQYYAYGSQQVSLSCQTWTRSGNVR